MPIQSQPTITELSIEELERILDEVEQALGDEKAQSLRQLLHAYLALTELIGEKSISIARLRRLLFGSPTERTRNAAGGQSESPHETTNDLAPSDAAPSDT